MRNGDGRKNVLMSGTEKAAFGKAAAKMREAAERAMSALKDAVYPENVTCDLCGAELTSATRYNLCGGCSAAMPFTEGRVCASCGVPVSDEADFCLRCQRSDYVFRMNRSALEYDGAARELIYSLKFGGRKYIAKLLGAMMSDAFLRFGMEADIIVPVPMTAAEIGKRGFNQSELLAEETGKRLSLPVLPALIKAKETSPQKELGGRERAENLKGVFTAAYSEWIRGRKILLVDDVFTTGATANECSRTLLAAGVKSVNVLTAAVTKERIAAERSEDGAR